MSHKAALKAAREFLTAAGGHPAPLSLSEEELNPTLQDDLSLRAIALESMDNLYPVPYSFPEESICTEFLFFEDGRQRTLQIGFIPTRIGEVDIIIPVHYFVVAAVILRRENRRLVLWDSPSIQQGILVQKSLVPDPQVLTRFEQQGLAVVDTEGEGGDYYELRNKALRVAKNLRLSVENDLITRWRRSADAESSFLIVDGTLMNFRNEDNVERCIGVSKSFGSRYFSVSDHARILQMEPFQRSWVFRFHDEDEDLRMGGRERLSWYLRLRKGIHVEPEFGLIRVEISRRHLGNASTLADRFSKSLLSERLPAAYPLPRWDKHLYPIRGCESYLTSLMPSIETIRASMQA
jgi:hypothetical protein